jgi:hypothetical protein
MALNILKKFVDLSIFMMNNLPTYDNIGSIELYRTILNEV